MSDPTVSTETPVAPSEKPLDRLEPFRDMAKRLEDCRPQGRNEKLYREALSLLYKTVLDAESIAGN